MLSDCSQGLIGAVFRPVPNLNAVAFVPVPVSYVFHVLLCEIQKRGPIIGPSSATGCIFWHLTVALAKEMQSDSKGVGPQVWTEREQLVEQVKSLEATIGMISSEQEAPELKQLQEALLQLHNTLQQHATIRSRL